MSADATLTPPDDAIAGAAATPTRSEVERRRAHRVRHLPWTLASMAVDGTVLALLSLIGLVPPSVLVLFAIGVTALTGLSWWMLRSGFSERFRDPFLSAYQLTVACGAIAGVAALVPVAAPHFFNVMLVVFIFGALRLSTRQTVVGGGLIALAAAGVMVMHADVPPPPPSPALTAITWLSYVTVFFRCLLVGLYGSSLRGRLKRRNAQLAESTARIEQLASHDELTGVLNRRAVWALLEGHATPPAGEHGRLCVALLDLDHFKQVNDRFGHQVGDEVLRRFCQVVKSGLREGDRLGRYGGEEFLLLLPQVGLESAQMVVERLRERVAAAGWDDLTPGAPVSVSVGVAAWRDGDSVAELIGRADAALYRAKADGRNRVVAAV